ncbi:MAG TPA: hypothetical protein EYQ58_00035 [Candidatus Poseidoniales archaeon]|nr:MAG: hypothetical protein CXT70_02150 [Euryarchaeota archaeon]HIF89943.1 hypothetical protein [Candidatus Poseidoniales archaeon]
MTKEVAPHSQPIPLFAGGFATVGSEIQNESRIISQQQIEPINLKYSPEVNLRTRSYYVFAIGLTFLIVFMTSAWTATNLMDLVYYFRLGNTLCFFFFAIAFFMNASYSKGKSDWKLSIGQSNSKSTSGMIFSKILGILCILIIVFVFVPMH